MWRATAAAEPEPLEPLIGQLYAWLARDPATGEEGIIAGYVPVLGTVPFVFSRRSLAEGLRDQAIQGAVAKGREAHLVAFRRTTVNDNRRL